MAITYIDKSSNNAFTAATDEAVIAPVTAMNDDLLVVSFAFESVAAGSGPYVSSGPTGWSRICYRAPSDTGTGIEVWAAILTASTGSLFNFSHVSSGDARESVYRGITVPGGHNVLALVADAQTAQNTGNDPVAPSATADVTDCLVVVSAADTLSGTGFGYPAPYTKRWDNARGGTFGNAEIASGDLSPFGPGATGTISLTAPVTPAGAKGTTATIVFRPSESTTLRDHLPLLGVS